MASSSSRTTLPSSIYTTGLGITSPTSTCNSTPRSGASGGWESPTFISRENRKDTGDSLSSTGSSNSTASNSKSRSYGSKKVSSPTVNVYTHCGRHSNQYLFGGWSKVFHKKN
ncbi:hypothetical protein VP1G_06582 [Cytospora mali]|uniref:Uncharacterized protein n=1 Tax=Cytospora mali TaxID=578113 RepID=A0A194V5X3_CYTMA|nr:hypothetical protein VP1G_06582 [Valsa mali var. pyri (nom. inval.)]